MFEAYIIRNETTDSFTTQLNYDWSFLFPDHRHINLPLVEPAGVSFADLVAADPFVRDEWVTRRHGGALTVDGHIRVRFRAGVLFVVLDERQPGVFDKMRGWLHTFFAQKVPNPPNQTTPAWPVAPQAGTATTPAGGEAQAQGKINPLKLTKRQAQIAGMYANGATAAEIANGLLVSEKTVRNHLSTIGDKLKGSSEGSCKLDWGEAKKRLQALGYSVLG